MVEFLIYWPHTKRTSRTRPAMRKSSPPLWVLYITDSMTSRLTTSCDGSHAAETSQLANSKFNAFGMACFADMFLVSAVAGEERAMSWMGYRRYSVRGRRSQATRFCAIVGMPLFRDPHSAGCLWVRP